MTLDLDHIEPVAEELYSAHGRELGGPFWNELPQVEREHIIRIIAAAQADYDEATDSQLKHVRDLDVALNGEDGAAKRPLLIDIKQQLLDAIVLARNAQGAGADAQGVKALEWEQRAVGLFADTPFGSYWIGHAGHRWWVRFNGNAIGRGIHTPSEAEAKVAAQADFEQRIRSCLVTPSKPSASEAVALLKTLLTSDAPKGERSDYWDGYRDGWSNSIINAIRKLEAATPSGEGWGVLRIVLDAFDRSDIPTHYHSHAPFCDAMAKARGRLMGNDALAIPSGEGEEAASVGELRDKLVEAEELAQVRKEFLDHTDKLAKALAEQVTELRAALEPVTTGLHVNDEELLRIRNMPAENGKDYQRIWSKMLILLVDAIREARARAREALTNTEPKNVRP